MTTRASEPPILLELVRIGKLFPVGGALKRKDLRALKDVSFSLAEKTVVALVGESGSGKSTIARLVARLIPPTTGEIRFKGKDVLKEEPRGASLEYRGQVQMIFQDPFGSLNPVHTVGTHLERPLILHKRVKTPAELRDRVHELLATVELHPPAEVAGKHPHQLSGGQRQRVAIARALAVDPVLILADEPVSMLDVSIRMGVLNLMQRLKEERGIAYLYITHDIASARYIGDRTMVMYAGHIVEAAPSDELILNPSHPYTKLLLSAVPEPSTSIRTDLEARPGAPELIDPPPGCPFAPRCPNVMDVCRSEMPAVTYIAGDHWVRCHLFPDHEAGG